MSLALLHAPAADALADLRALLAALGRESGELAGVADGLQLLFGGLMEEPPRRPPDALEQAQALDGLVQRLQGLEAFLQGLCAGELDDVGPAAATAARALRLTSQARRFNPAGEAAAAEIVTGDCDLF